MVWLPSKQETPFALRVSLILPCLNSFAKPWQAQLSEGRGTMKNRAEPHNPEIIYSEPQGFPGSMRPARMAYNLD